MKQFYLKSLFLCLLSMIGSKASAHDIAVKNADSVTIYYRWINNKTELEVTSNGNEWIKYSGKVVIPKSVLYDGKTYSVTNIGRYAFFYCSGLTSVTIPNSVTNIGDWAFYGCSGLTSVTIGNSVTTIGEYAFYGCSGLTSVTIPNSVTNIDILAFYGCSGLTSVTIPNSVTNIGGGAFDGCSGLTSIAIESGNTNYDSRDNCNAIIETSTNTLILGCMNTTIPNSVTTIGDYAFSGCTGLTSIDIPNSVTSIGEGTFSGCTSLTSITLPDFLRSVSADSFGDKNKKFTLNVHRGTPTLLTLWSKSMYNYNQILEIETNKDVSRCYTATPTTIQLYDFQPLDGLTISSEKITLGGQTVENKLITGLEPNNYINKIKWNIALQNNEGETVNYSISDYAYTNSLTLTIQQPKVISAGNVIVAAETNIDDEEENVGFEWRRTDWTDDFQSNSGAAYLYEGTMEGYIRNLNTEKLWKYRAYYESASGQRYYSDWVGLDPTNTSYFEPTVHTYAQISVSGNTATVRGYAQRGTDNITSQGFRYWPQTANSRSNAPAAVPSNAMTAEVKGTVMETELTGLDYNTDYCYVAFVTTSEGETFYGDVRQFATEPNPSGISNIKARAEAVPVDYFDLRGRRLNTAQRGMNIVRMSDGTTRKIWKK